MNTTHNMSSQESEGIFERSLSFSKSNMLRSKLVRTMLDSTQFGSPSYSLPSHHSTEDFVAPVLDTTTEIITNPELDPRNVNIVCSREESEDLDAACATEDEEIALSRPPTAGSRTKPLDKLRPRLTPRSLICNSLMLLMGPPRRDSLPISTGTGVSTSAGLSATVSASETASPPRLQRWHSGYNLGYNSGLQGSAGSMDGSRTINFYLFADVLETEKEPDALDHDMESPTTTSPPRFKRFSFSEPLHHEIQQLSPQGTFSIGENTVETGNQSNAATIDSHASGGEEPIPEGFMSMTTKDNISKLT